MMRKFPCIRSLFAKGVRFVCPNQSVARLPPWLPVDYRPRANTCRTSISEQEVSDTRHDNSSWCVRAAIMRAKDEVRPRRTLSIYCLRLICEYSDGRTYPWGALSRRKGKTLRIRFLDEEESATKRTRRRRNSGIFFFLLPANIYIPLIEKGTQMVVLIVPCSQCCRLNWQLTE